MALGGLNKGDLQKFWIDTLGMSKINSFKSERENVDEDVLECGKGLLGKIEVDIMTPLDPEKSPKVHIPPLNHIGLWVDDLPKCVEHLESKSLNYFINWIKILNSFNIINFRFFTFFKKLFIFSFFIIN